MSKSITREEALLKFPYLAKFDANDAKKLLLDLMAMLLIGKENEDSKCLLHAISAVARMD
jgi:hypothetical protein